MEQFIREKIKDKPLNKKRLAKKAGTAALCGVAFAVSAGYQQTIKKSFRWKK